MLRVEIPNDKTKILKQIKALNSLLITDNKKDFAIHIAAIKELKKALKES